MEEGRAIKFEVLVTYAERALKRAVARRTHEVERAKRKRDREVRLNELTEKRKRLEHERHLRAHSRALRLRLSKERNMTMDEILKARENTRS